MTVILKEDRQLEFDKNRLDSYIEKAFEGLPLDRSEFTQRAIRSIELRPTYEAEGVLNKLILTALENVSRLEPQWDKVATRFKLNGLYKAASKNRGYNSSEKYGSFLNLVVQLTEMGVYSPELLQGYSTEEITEFGFDIAPERDDLFVFGGLSLLAERYLANDFEGNTYELPQERYMIIAMQLMINETVDRTEKVKEAYWALSNLYMSVATPTLGNAGKSVGQFSSCFIDTVDDSLRGIMDSNTDFSLVSKSGGGQGIYMGKVRSQGSDIRNYKGASGGIVPWIKQANNTAVAVDQLGKRQGAVAVYLDTWHKDIMPFLELKLNNGDERRRAHDIFTGVTIPDLFMERLDITDDNGRSIGQWSLFDPHEVKNVMGYSIEDYYDEKVGSGSFRTKYVEMENHPLLSRKTIKAMDVMKAIMKAQLETGTPYMFYRDEVNRQNPNKHAGMIYCSNLCTEITQNMSPTTVEQEYVTMKDGVNKLIIVKNMGDFVVCNLSSINLARAVIDDVMERLISIQVRMLDNVIDLNETRIEIKQAVETNRRYRAIGLGTFGYHHLLALKGIKWESDEAVELNDRLYEKIAFLTISESNKLSKEKGQYPMFDGSEWQTGEYFTRKGYDSPEWNALAADIRQYGIRNGHLMAVAPNSATALIAGTTQSTDPIFKQEYAEEKKGLKFTNIAPDLNSKTTWFYKSGYHIDQHWSIKQNAARQKHIDQSISFNFFIPKETKAKDLLALHRDAWKSGLKTTYYVRSTSQAVIDDCDSCQ